MNFKTSYKWEKNNVYNIAILGILLGINIASKYLFSLIPSMPFSISFSLTYFILIVSCYLLRSMILSLILLFISPLVWLAIGRATSVSFGDFALTYWVPVICLWLINFIHYLEKYKTNFLSWTYLIIYTLLVMGVIKFLLVTTSGQLYYGITWEGSLIFNIPNAMFDLALTLVLLLFTYLPFFKLKQSLAKLL